LVNVLKSLNNKELKLTTSLLTAIFPETLQVRPDPLHGLLEKIFVIAGARPIAGRSDALPVTQPILSKCTFCNISVTYVHK